MAVLCLLLLLLLLLLCCRPQASGVSSPCFQPPPLLVSCWGTHGQVFQQQDNELRVSCLWSSTVNLRYRPALGARPKVERKAGWPQSPPHCSWYLNSAWVKNTSRWSGQVTLQTGLLPGNDPPPMGFSLLTVQCSSASCAAPECFHHNVSVQMAAQDMRLFVLWPQTHLILVRQPVELGWCARLKSVSWQYRFSSQGGSPSTLLLPSSEHQETLPLDKYPTAELQQTCATYYKYRLTLRYGHPGLHVASVSIEQMPQISINISLKVEPDLLRVLSISSKFLSVSQQPLSLSWRLQPLTLQTVAYRLVDTQAIGGWVCSYSAFALQSNFCVVPTPQSLGEVVVASIYFPVDGKRFEELTGEIRLLNGTLSLTAGRETPTHVKLQPGKTNSSTYTFRDTHGTFYTTKDNHRPIYTDVPNTHTVFYQHKGLSYLFSIEFVAFHSYKFNMYLYVNQKRALVRSLAERDLEVHVFSSSHPFLQNFTYLVWFIPAQHPMLQCEWTFHLQIFGTQKDHLLQNSTYTYNDHVRNAKHFVRRSALPFDAEKYTGFVAKVNCTRSALTPALLRARVNNYAAKTIEAPVSCQEKTCQIHSVYIQRPTLHTSILQQKRASTFILSAKVVADCRVVRIVKPFWRVYPLQDIATIPDWTNPMNISSLDGIEKILLTVPRFALDYGLYLFNFTFEIIVAATKEVVKDSDGIYVLIERSSLVANIAGGRFRTVGFYDNWVLNGSASYDPDSDTEETLVGITFTWYCTKEASDYKNMKISPGKKCHPAQSDLKWLRSSGPVQAMSPESLPGNAMYYFRLAIQKDTRMSYADQTVNVQPGSQLLLDVTCLENCGSSLIPTERFTLSGKCLNCRAHNKPVYFWSLFSENSTEISFDWSSRTSTGRYGTYLSIHALTFTKTAHPSYILLLKVTTWDGRSSIYKYAFKINIPPRPGKCTINPRWGTAFLTKFVVQCSGFSDSNLPLTYKVIVASDKTTKITSVKENTFGVIMYFGYQPKTPPSFLPIGAPSQKYTLTLYVQIYDSLGTFTQVNLYARVQNPIDSRPVAAVFHELLASISGFSAPMTSYLQTGDYFSAGYLAYLTASVLNYIKATPTTQLPNTQFRESLIKIAINISVESIMEINQVVASLSQVTDNPGELNFRSQDLAVRKLAEVTGLLKIQRNKKHWSEEAEIQSSGILTCLSNILRAALLRRRNVNVGAVKQAFSIMENLSDIVLQGKVPGETGTLIETKHWNITLKKDENLNSVNASSATNACRNCFYPSLKKGSYSELPHNALISTALFEFDENPFPWLGYTTEITTTVFGFKMVETKANGDQLGIVPEEAEITIARKDKEFSTFQLTVGPDKTEAYTTGGFTLEVSGNTKTIYIQILTKLEVTFKVLVFTGSNITDAHPIASFAASHNMPTVASKTETASADCNIKAPYIICLPESLLTATAQGSGSNTQNISVVLMTPYFIRYQSQRLVSIYVFSDQCLFLEGVQSLWREDTCRLGSMTDWRKIHCVCNMKRRHRSLSVHAALNTSTLDIRFLAAKAIVMPNTVDLGKILIADIHKNPVTLLTALFIFAIYFLLSLWAIRKDKADRVSKNKIVVLPDNDPFDKVSFLVTIYTGSRWGAGTTANVFLQLIGQNGMSDVHCLWQPHFPSFQKGSTNCFLLTAKEDLGDVCFLRVWHNNKGPSPSWFLSRAKVVNMSTRKTWFFLCRKWLSLDKGDCLIERTFSVTNPKTLLPRTDYFLIKLAHSLTEGHLWLSIFANDLTGTYSRLQRLSSCLAILLLNLLVNIMFFNAMENEESSVHLRYLRSVTLGIECALLTLPVEMMIIAFFKNSQKGPLPPRGVVQRVPKGSSHLLSGNHKNSKEHLQKSHLSEQPRNISPSGTPPAPNNSQNPPHSKRTGSKGAPQNWRNCTVPERDASVIGTEEQPITASSPPVAEACQRRPPSHSSVSKNYTEAGGNSQEERKSPGSTSMLLRKRAPIVFNWWCVYVSWALVIAITGLSSLFIVLYGLSYGYQTSLEWLIASAASFIEDVFLLSVLKIIFFSAVSTIRPKHCEDIPWLSQGKGCEFMLAGGTMSADEMREAHLKLAEVRGSKQYRPLEADEIAKMRKRAKIKVKAFIFTAGFISHLVFLTLLLNFAYPAEKASSYHYNKFIHQQFSPQLSSADKLEDIYVWVKEVFLPLIHNDVQPTLLPQSWSKIIGLPRMRQVRAKGTEKKCSHPHIFLNNSVIRKSHCLHQYGSDIPETGDYAGTWTRVAKQSVSKDASSYNGFMYEPNKTPWMYYSYGDLYTYGPAGYTFYFFPEEGRSNSTTRLDALQQNNWLDEKTWAVIIELTTFNSDVALFCTISVIFEMSHLGIIKPSLSVHSFALPIFNQQTKAQMFVSAIVFAFLIIYIADELYVIGREKKDYMKKISNIINFALKLAFLLLFLLKGIKFKMGEDIVNFYLLHPNDFICFHAVSLLDQLLRGTMGFLAFLVILKTLKYSQFFYDTHLAQRSLLAALPGISSVAVIVALCFFVFLAFGYLVFGQHEKSYNNMIHSAQTIVSYCISAFRDTKFSSNRLLGGLFLASFVVVKVCVLISLFQAVIMSAYSDMKQPVYEEPSDETQMVTFVLQRLRRMFYLLICKKSKTSETDLSHRAVYGQSERRRQRHLGLKSRKIHGRKMVYLVI